MAPHGVAWLVLRDAVWFMQQRLAAPMAAVPHADLDTAGLGGGLLGCGGASVCRLPCSVSGAYGRGAASTAGVSGGMLRANQLVLGVDQIHSAAALLYCLPASRAVGGI